MTFRPDADRWLSTAECARSIGVSYWWIRERINAGILPATAIRTGHRKVLKVRALGSGRVGGGKKRRPPARLPSNVVRQGGSVPFGTVSNGGWPRCCDELGVPGRPLRDPNPRVETKRADSTDGAHCQVPE